MRLGLPGHLTITLLMYQRSINEMGFGGISAWQLGILLLIIMVLFGTKKIRTIGVDLGEALRGFKKGMVEAESVAKEIEKDE